jgi:penicillin-binding protein 2
MKKLGRINRKGREIDNPVMPLSQINEEKRLSDEETRNNKWNYLFILSMVFVCFLIILGRSFYLQIVQGEYYKEIAENNRIRTISIKAPRGVVYDKNKEILANNVPSFDVVFIPKDLPQGYGERKQIYTKLAEVIEMNEANLGSMMETIDKESNESFLIKDGISHEKALTLMGYFSDLKGVYLDKTAQREYVDGPIFSQIIGYDGKITQEEMEENPDYLMTDYIGKNGLEYSYEKWLRGKHGQHQVEVDSNGNIKEDLGIVNPVLGDELHLHIDAGLQRKADEVLKKILEENKDATGASLVAINPQNGGVLALVNLPSYDNNLFARGISKEDYGSLVQDKRKPMLNRAVSGEYPPGSTFKPFVASAALEEGVVTEDTSINCPGLISVGSWKFPDWKTHGVTDIKKAIAESCDVFFYAVGGGWNNIPGLGINRIKKYAEFFGMGNLLGIDLPWEAEGNIPGEHWKFGKFGEKWYIGDDYHCAIGQGFITTTPLQLATATAAVANGGKLYRPQVVDYLVDQEGNQRELNPEILNEKFVSKKNIEIVREGMRETVAGGNGSARQLGELETATAGKTGTAQFGNEDKLHSWYISFGPYENPEIAMVVLIEGGGEGHDWAVPATKEIYKWYFEEQKN